MALTVETIHFIGGQGTKAGSSNSGGGCTKAAWEDAGKLNEDLDNVMDANGGSIATPVYVTIRENTGYVELYKEGGFSSDYDGLIVNIPASTGTLPDDRYIITSATADTLVLNIIWAAGHAGTCSAFVGGAFDTYQHAIDNIDDASDYGNSRWVYSNKDVTLSSTLTMNLVGVYADNAHVYFIGYNLVPGDRDIGGTYFGTLTDIDADAGAYHLLTYGDADENIHWNNFKFHNTASNEHAAYLAASGAATYGFFFDNCEFDDILGVAIDAAAAYSSDITIHNCTFGTGNVEHIFLRYCGNAIIDRCIFKDGAVESPVNVGGGTFINNIVIGGERGLQQSYEDSLLLVLNNTFYLQTDGAIMVNRGGTVVENNICYLTAAADFGVGFHGFNEPNSIHIKNNCVWSAAGAVTNPFYDDTNSLALPSSGSVLEDPDFVDAASLDFTPQNVNVLYGGKLDLNEYVGPMGAIKTTSRMTGGLGGTSI